MSALSGPLRGPSVWNSFPQATQIYGLCALGLPQVKASGLVQTYGLLSCSPAVLSVVSLV